MYNRGILLLQLLMLPWNCGLDQDITCWEGHRLHTPKHDDGGDVCIPCKEETFMTETNHRNRECNECSKIINHLEIIKTACNKTHDTEIQCVSGYYRRKAQTALENDTCEECRVCEPGFPARPCLGYNDTVCCPLQHDAVWTCEGKYECQERPACGAGMYYNTSVDICLSCPRGTYMQTHAHSARECPKCEVLSGNSSNHAVILQPCTRTSPTVFGCEYFHFRANDSGSLLDEAPCRPCQNCSRYLRQCQIFHDAVCAEDSHEDNNSIEDTGLDEDTKNGTRRTSVTNDTLPCNERNESNRAQNRVTEFQTSVPSDVYADVVLFVTLIGMLIAHFVAIIRTDKADTIQSQSSGACSRFKTPRIMIAIVGSILLFVFLIICALLKTGAIEASRDVVNACFITAVLAEWGYVIAVICHTKRPKKPQVTEKRRPRSVGDDDSDDSDDLNRKAAEHLWQFQMDIEESQG